MKSSSIIRLSKSCIGAAEKKAVIEVLDREYLGMGDEVQKFEKMLEDFFGRKVVCVSNGTSAIQLALHACGIGQGDEVLVPSLTYIATFQAISATGAIPIACDVEENSLLLDTEDLEKRITKKTKAIIPVHYCGGITNLEKIHQIAHKYQLRIIEDAAHSFGSLYKGNIVGSFGDISCFSFDGIKNITSGEGGCIVTSDKKIINFVNDARLLGVEKDSEKRYLGQRSWEFDVTNQGWRYHMSNIMAAIGIVQLKNFPKKALIRQKLAKKYDEFLSGNSKIITLERDYSTIIPHIYVVRIPGLKNRKDLQLKLLEKNIQTGVHYQPNHLLTFYKSSNNLRPLSITEKIYPEILTLPLHPEITIDNIKYIVYNLNSICNQYI